MKSSCWFHTIQQVDNGGEDFSQPSACFYAAVDMEQPSIISRSHMALYTSV